MSYKRDHSLWFFSEPCSTPSCYSSNWYKRVWNIGQQAANHLWIQACQDQKKNNNKPGYAGKTTDGCESVVMDVMGAGGEVEREKIRLKKIDRIEREGRQGSKLRRQIEKEWVVGTEAQQRNCKVKLSEWAPPVQGHLAGFSRLDTSECMSGPRASQSRGTSWHK